MRMTGTLVALVSLAALAAAPTGAHAQTYTRKITCESTGGRRDCFVANLDQGSVSVDRQLSKSDCDRGSSWGTSRDNIWVSEGCRASFAYRTRSGGGSSSSGGSQYGKITCESKGGGRHDCYVANLDESSVTVDDKLSDAPCVSGRSWGTSQNKIWVSDGCRARFAYVQRSGQYNSNQYNNNQYNNNGGGSSRGGREACLERASREWSVTKENLEVTGTNRLDNGQTEFLVKSKRTNGSCYVDNSGFVRKFSTW
jgi:hypothetical protein